MSPASKKTASAPETHRPPSPADEAWALLRQLLFTERRRFMATASEFNLHPAQAGALMQMSDGDPMPMHEMATRLACDNSNVTGIVDRLEARGLVTRRPSEQDRRVKHIELTPDGLAVRDRMRGRMAAVPAWIERLSPEDQQALRDIVQRALTPDDPRS